MSLVYLALGLLLLGVVIVDLSWTTIWVAGGAGPLTSRSMAWTWKLLRKLAPRNSRVLTLAGPVVLVLSFTTWILLLWLGWTFLFASADGAIVDTVDGRQVSWSELLYFTGYTIFTLGIGDFIPQGGRWQILTAVASASGLLFITLAVTYTLSVLEAVTQKRVFASSISVLGTSGAQILKRSWDGHSFQGLEIPLNSIANQLNTLTSNHRAYPILHYFYSAQREQAPTTSIAVLDDALTLLRHGVPERDRPDEIVTTEPWISIQQYLDTLYDAYIEPADRTPPSPAITELRDERIPTVPDEEFADSLAELDERRRTLLGLVESDEREWSASSND